MDKILISGKRNEEHLQNLEKSFFNSAQTWDKT